MADEKPPFPEVKEYVRNYSFEKEHQDTYKKLLGAYSIKDRKADNRLHQQSKKKTLTDLDSMMGDVDAIEHEDHLYKLLGKVLHKYDNAKVEVHNKTAASDKKKSKLDYNDLAYKRKVKELVAQYLHNNKGHANMETMINNIKEGNIETVINELLEFDHLVYQQEVTMHKMEEILPPNKDPNFYFKLANFAASKRQEDFTETDLRQHGASRESLLNMIRDDYRISTNNALKKLKPEKKK
jgi:hypothetical protein